MHPCAQSIPTAKSSTTNPRSVMKRLQLTWLEHCLIHRLPRLFILTKIYIRIINVRASNIIFKSQPHWYFQPMECGCGQDGQHAPPRVEQVLAPDQQHHVMGHSMPGWIAVAVGHRLKAVKVCFFNKGHSKESFILSFAVEGTWSAWGAWGTCTTTCNSGSRTRTRGYTGGQPCTGSSSDTGNCDSELSKICFLPCNQCTPWGGSSFARFWRFTNVYTF